jgi:23S rRNA (adenine2503-C2)-methyltransferase
LDHFDVVVIGGGQAGLGVGYYLRAAEAHYERKRRQIFIEYVMLAGVNDGYAQAVQMAKLLNPAIYKVNLIPYNPTDSVYDGSSRNSIDAFKAALEEHGLRATVRLTRGRDIDAACGQLAAREFTPAAPAPAGAAHSA